MHPPSNGLDDNWYTVDILPTTDVVFLCNALDNSEACANYNFNGSQEKENILNTKELARMLTDKQYISLRYYESQQSIPKFDKNDSSILPRILELRKMMHSEEFSHLSYGARFKKAARVVEDLEDDCQLESFYPFVVSYESNMSDLRAYFTWRTRFRKGKLPKVPDAFATLFATEVVNGIGWTDPAEGDNLLYTAFTNLVTYRYCSRYLRWLYDFSAYYNIPNDWEFDYTSDEMLVLKLLHPEEITSDNVIDLLNGVLGSGQKYDLEGKKAYLARPDDYKEVLVRFLRILMSGNGAEGQSSNLVLTWYNDSWYDLFCGLQFQPDEDHGTYIYQLNEMNRYKFEGNYCTYSKCRLSSKFSASIRDILTTFESLMRKEFGLPKTKEKLSPENEYYQCIVKAINEWKNRKNKREVVIDSSRLESVRQEAQETSQKIMTSEETDDVPDIKKEVTPKKTPNREPVAPVTNSLLDENELRFLAHLITGADWRAFLKQKRLILSLIVDSVNEKLFEQFGDTVLEIQDGDPVIVADYQEDVEKIIWQ